MERSAKLRVLNQTLSGFRAVGRRHAGKGLVGSHKVEIRRDDAEIDGDSKVL